MEEWDLSKLTNRAGAGQWDTTKHTPEENREESKRRLDAVRLKEAEEKKKPKTRPRKPATEKKK